MADGWIGDDDGERDIRFELEDLRRFVEEKVGEVRSEKGLWFVRA